MQHGGARRRVSWDGSEVFAVRDAVRPGEPERSDAAVKLGERGGVGRQHRAKDPDPAVKHDPACRHPGEEGQLGVPLLDTEREPALDPVAVLVADNLLFGHVQARTAARPLAGDPELADHREKREGRGCGCGACGRGPGTRGTGARPGRARIDSDLRRRIVELRAGTDPGALDAGRADIRPVERGTAIGVELDRPDERAPILVREQRGAPLTEFARVQRHRPVRKIEGLAAAPCLGVERAARRHKARHVGDRVAEHEPGAAGALDMERLVEVTRLRWVERHKLDVAEVEIGDGRRGRDGLCERFRWERVDDPVRLPERGERRGELAAWRVRCDVRPPAGHGRSLAPRPQQTPRLGA